jgi:hypothetical protein
MLFSGSFRSNIPILRLRLYVCLGSGIASLFKKKEGQSETEMNDPQHVEIVPKRNARPYLQGISGIIRIER